LQLSDHFPEEKNNVTDTTETNHSSLELLYNIGRELASDLDLRTVLQRVLLLSVRSIGGISGSIIVLNQDGDPVDSALYHTGQVYDQTTRQLRTTLDKGLAGWVMHHKEMALIPDTSMDSRWTKRPDDAPDKTGAKSAVGVPLMARDALVGVMTLAHPNPGTFNESHSQLLQAISDQAGMTILNARLYKESQQQTRVMAALAESSAALTGALGTDDILQQVLTQIHQALQVEAVSLALINPDEETLTIRAATGQASSSVLDMNLRMGQGIVGWVAKEGKGAIISDVKNDHRFDPTVDTKTGFETRAVACAPIVSQGEVIGVLEAFNPIDGQFDGDTLFVLNGIGSLAGSVIRHGQLFDQLQAARNSYQELFEDSIDPIIITTWQGKIVDVNRRAAEALLHPKDELTGQLVFDHHDYDENKAQGAFFSKLASRETITYESCLFPKDAPKLPVEVHVRQIIFQNQELLQWMFRDITERKELDNMRDDLISMIYHDLRSPLANVVYSMDVLDSMLPEDSELEHTLVEVAVRSTERIKRLTSSLLDMKTLEAGQPVANKESTTPADIVEFGVQAVRSLAENKEMAVEVDIAADLPGLDVDKDMIRRVIINLLENAVKYTPNGSKIATGASANDEGIHFWVKDNGPGIPPEKQGAIFDKYARLQGGKGGIGLGLAFCRLAVEGHGGRIWVESENGQGSRFVFTLPKN
jgi:PAS domain S-box-containing protein